METFSWFEGGDLSAGIAPVETWRLTVFSNQKEAEVLAALRASPPPPEMVEEWGGVEAMAAAMLKAAKDDFQP